MPFSFEYYGPETADWGSGEGAIVFYGHGVCAEELSPSASFWLVPGTEDTLWAHH